VPGAPGAQPAILSETPPRSEEDYDQTLPSSQPVRRRWVRNTASIRRGLRHDRPGLRPCRSGLVRNTASIRRGLRPDVLSVLHLASSLSETPPRSEEDYDFSCPKDAGASPKASETPPRSEEDYDVAEGFSCPKDAGGQKHRLDQKRITTGAVRRRVQQVRLVRNTASIRRGLRRGSVRYLIITHLN